MTPRFQEIYEGVVRTLSEARTKGSKTGSKTIIVVFDKGSPVKTAAGVKPMLEEMRKEYFSYLKRNYEEEHGKEDAKKFEPMFKTDAQKAAWDRLVTVKKTYADKNEEKGDVFVVELGIDAGVANDFMNQKIIKDKYFKYHFSVAPIEDLLIGSSYQGVMDPKENPLVQANERLKKKYKFVADVLKGDSGFVAKAERKAKKQKFLRQDEE